MIKVHGRPVVKNRTFHKEIRSDNQQPGKHVSDKLTLMQSTIKCCSRYEADLPLSDSKSDRTPIENTINRYSIWSRTTASSSSDAKYILRNRTSHRLFVRDVAAAGFHPHRRRAVRHFEQMSTGRYAGRDGNKCCLAKGKIINGVVSSRWSTSGTSVTHLRSRANNNNETPSPSWSSAHAPITNNKAAVYASRPRHCSVRP